MSKKSKCNFTASKDSTPTRWPAEGGTPRRWRSAVGVIVFLVLLSGCVSVYNPVSGKKEWYIFDEKGEVSWGDAMARQFIDENKINSDPEKNTVIAAIGNKVAAVSHRNNLTYHFYIIDAPEVNALAIPGGHIFVYRGLLDKVSQQELAFVLAHEIGHVSARHSLKQLGASLSVSVLAATLLRTPEQTQAKQMVDQLYGLISLGYSRKDELEADSLAFQYVNSAGYQPRAALTLFKKLEAENNNRGQVPFYLSSHPDPEARIKNIEDKLRVLNQGGTQ
ncbi:MAG: M48 family metalloprotease [Candidatus Omnitrophica bacterium]|nr:M48 family metalloprotease [Candidatus Omnitrophota bacterium]MBU2044514.1 M48 family metalloprotease [Candidatus Omnitrophota bacterium]MBU2266018.1 M48 family metalloprotease [Candidatus Omnitrophota bacterium]MBU2473405.1 M48 family metalloprotease [Candidatus Omnitrophota bacterium]